MTKLIGIVFLCVIILLLLFIFLDKSHESPFNFETSYTKCLELNDNTQTGECLRGLASVALGKSTIQDIEKSLEPTLGTKNSEWCHEFMHYLGWNKALRSKTLAEGFAGSSFMCVGGMFHGVVEQHLSNLSSEIPLEEKVLLVASECENSTENTQSNCYHGLGHSFMFVTDNELLQSTKLCERLPRNQLQNCLTGVFMEITQPKQATSAHKVYNLDEITAGYPCDQLMEQSKKDCFIYRGSLNFYLSNQNSKLAFEKCSQLKNYKNDCYQGVGYSLLRPNWNTTVLANDCDSAREIEHEAFNQCIKGVVPFIMETTNGNPDAANEFCELLSEENTKCHTEVKNILKLINLNQ